MRYRKHGTRFMLGSKTQKRRVTKKIMKIYGELETQKSISKNDFPDSDELKNKLRRLKWNKFPLCSAYLMQNKDKLVKDIIPKLVTRINDAKVHNIFEIDESPFAFEKGEGFDEGLLENDQIWIVDKYRHKWMELFKKLSEGSDKISASKAKAFLLETNLSSKILSKIWKISDVDGDEMLDLDEFLLAMYLVSVKIKKNEAPIPDKLPDHLVPPSKRR